MRPDFSGRKNPFFGKKHTKISKEKMRIAHVGKKLSNEHRKKIGIAGLGRKRSLLTRKKISKSLSGRKRPPFSEEWKKKMSDAHKGDKCYLWRGGVTPEIRKIRNSREHSEWRRAVLVRDNFECVKCGSKKRIEADHIKQFAFYPKLRFEITNGRALCHSCHKKTKTYRNKQK